MSVESSKFSPLTQRELSLTLDSTRNTISLVSDNIRSLRDSRARGERRIEELTEELERTRLKVLQAESRDAQAANRRESLQRQLDLQTRQLENEKTEHRRVALDLSSARELIDELRSQLNAVSSERDALLVQKDDCDGIRRDKLALERQLAKTAAFVAAQEQAVVASFEERLRDAALQSAALQQALDAEKAGAKTLEGRLTEASDAAGTLEQQGAERVEALAGLREELAGSKASQDALEAGLARLRDEADGLDKQLSSSEEQRRELEEQLHDVTEGRAGLSDELSIVRDSLARSVEELERLQRELAEAQATVEAQAAELAATEELREALRFDVDVSRSALTDLKHVLDEPPEDKVGYDKVVLG